MAVDKARAEAAIREFLIAVGEDPDRPGLLETPDRVARAAQEVLGGYDEDPSLHLRKQFHENDNEEMVIVRDIPFSSLCEHHILPFTGKAHVPIFHTKAHHRALEDRPLRERLCAPLAAAGAAHGPDRGRMMAELRPRGVLVVLEAEHMCMTMRGVRAAGALTTTSAVRGTFRSDIRTREEALRLLGL